MRVSAAVRCQGFRCGDVDRGRHTVPGLDLDQERITVVLISEAPATQPNDDYYAGGDSLFDLTTIQAFSEAGADVSSIDDLRGLGVYLTTAVKCGKTGYGISAETITECSLVLERELALFPNARAYLLMGDVAIAAINHISRRAGHGRAIPYGSTYKIRGGEYHMGGIRLFPSYVQAGPAYFIEKSKREMIAQDIAAALCVAAER